VKRLEHSDIVEACKTAIQNIVDSNPESFSRRDVVDRVMQMHPDADRARVELVAKMCLQAMDGSWPHEQVDAFCEEAKRHAATLPDEEAEAYLNQKADELRQMCDRRLVEAYFFTIGNKLLERHGRNTMHDLITGLGEDAFLTACREELRRDGRGEFVTIHSGDRDLVYPIEDFMRWFQIEAERTLRPKREKVIFHFPTGPEEAA
jgi:hypothetical protein